MDDSEADLYEPKYYVRPAKMGFFVCTGLLELETQKRKGRLLGSKNKPKGGDTSTPQNGANRTSTTSTREYTLGVVQRIFVSLLILSSQPHQKPDLLTILPSATTAKKTYLPCHRCQRSEARAP